jgi:mannose-6-phosphate isomerase-like protein (cupin superfamily)
VPAGPDGLLICLSVGPHEENALPHTPPSTHPGQSAGVDGAANTQEKGMSVTTKYLRRDPADVKPWAETCGQIRPLIEEADGAAAEVHHVEIDHARLHYHERTDEVYYIIDGHGTMVLDEETIELHRGVVVYVPRGVRHKAVGRLVVLTVCIPPGVLGDVHELE